MLRAGQEAVVFDDDTYEMHNYRGSGEKREVKKRKEMGIQSSLLNWGDKETQTMVRKRHVNIQVNEQNLRQTALIQSLQRQKEEQTDEETVNKRLSVFLKEQLGKVLEVLEENSQTQVPQLQDYIFEREGMEWVVNEPMKVKSMLLKEKGIHQEHEQTITSIDFNCSGFTCAVAVSLTQYQHMGSCNSSAHKAHLYIFNLSQSNLPPILITYPSCINVIKFHPIKPNVLWLGTLTGQLLIVDTTLEKVIMESKIDDYFHRESIIDILFFHQKYQNQSIYNVGSLSSDGKILLWDMKEFNKAQQQIQLEHGNNQNNLQFNLLNCPDKGYMLLKKRDNQVNLVGISCVAQHSTNDQLVVIGSETGQVYRAFIKNIVYTQDKTQRNLILNNIPKTLTYAEQTIQFLLNLLPKNILDVKMTVEQYCVKQQIQGNITVEHVFESRPDLRKVFQNPMDFIFEQHLGPVHSLSFSPFVPNTFLSGSYDGMVRLYDVYQNKSLLQHHHECAHYLQVEWSVSRPSIIMAITSDHLFNIYDLTNQNRWTPVLQCYSSALAFALNPKQPELISIAFADFRLSIMTLDPSLLEPGKDDVGQLNTLLHN